MNKKVGYRLQTKSVGFESYLLSEVFDYLCNQISKAHVSPRERYCFTLGCFEKVSKFRKARIKANASLYVISIVQFMPWAERG